MDTSKVEDFNGIRGMLDFGLDAYKTFHTGTQGYAKGYRYLVLFVDGSLGVVLENGTYYADDPLYSN